MQMSARSMKLLDAMLSTNDYITLSSLATLGSSSSRTVFRECKALESVVKEYDLSIKTKPGCGIKIVGYEESKASLRLYLSAHAHGFMDKKARQQVLVLELLKQKQLQKLFYYANKLKVSEATISNDIDAVEAWFTKHGLAIQRTPGIGIVLVGEEEDYRKAITTMLYEAMQEHGTYQSNEEDWFDEMFFQKENQSILHLLDQSIVRRIQRVFKEHRSELLLVKYTQSSYMGLLIHLSVAIDRIIKQEEIEGNESILKLVEHDVSFDQAMEIAHLLEREFDIRIPKLEVAFIAMHLKGAKLRMVQDVGEVSQKDSKERLEIITLIYRMIDLFDPVNEYQLKRDEEFIQGLYAHLRPTLVRLQYELPIHNPLLEQLKGLYSAIFERTKQAGSVFHAMYGYVVPETEIGFIAMHFGAAIERLRHHEYVEKVVSIGVICSSGIGTSSLLAARIKSIFRGRVVVTPLSLSEAMSQEHEYDVFVSTFAIGELNSPALIVHPLLKQADIVRLEQIIQQIPNSKKYVVEQSTTSFLAQLKKLQELSRAMVELLENFCVVSVDASLQKQELMSLIGYRVASSKEKGALIYRDLLARELLGSTCYEPLQFMLLHTDSEGVESLQFQIYVPTSAVFASTELQGIRYVMLLLVPKQSSSIIRQVMSVLSRSVLEKEEYRSALESGDEAIIRRQLELLLQEYLETGCGTV